MIRAKSYSTRLKFVALVEYSTSRTYYAMVYCVTIWWSKFTLLDILFFDIASANLFVLRKKNLPIFIICQHLPVPQAFKIKGMWQSVT